MEVTYTDGRWKDVGVIRDMKLDVDYGDESNSFEISLPSSGSVRIATGALIYVEGTEYGGRVTRPGVRTAQRELVYGGPTWHGLLAQRTLCPPDGQDYLEVEGEANAVIASLLARIDAGGLFIASDKDTEVTIPKSTVRYTDAWKALRVLLDPVGLRPSLSYVMDHVIVSAVPSVTAENDNVDVEMNDEIVPVNHLICLGKGTLKDRTRIDLYADRQGNISRTQTIFGIDYRDQVYDYPNAEPEELLKSGMEKLAGLQDESKMTTTFGFEYLEDRYGIGDRLYKLDDETGVSAIVPIGQKTVTINSKGELRVTYGPKNGSETSSAA